MKIFTESMSYRQYIKYLIPSVLTMVFLSFYTTIDGFFVSRYANTDALAGINIVIPITCIIFGTSIMLATGGGAIIGEYLGKEDVKKANETFTAISIVLLILSLLFTIFGIIFLKPMAILLGTSERLMPHVLPYLFVVLAGAIPMSFKLFFEYMVRTDGNAKVGLKMSIVGLVLNVVLDYLFVGVLRYGTFGAALGTVLSISASALIGLHHFLHYSNIHFAKPVFVFKTILRSFTNGTGEMLTELSTGITTFLFNIIIMQKMGEDGIAAVTIIMYIYYFFIAFYMGISVTSAPIISYNYGANKLDRIKDTIKYSYISIVLTAIFIVITLYFGGDFIIRLFANQQHVYELTVNALKYFSPVFIFIGINVFMSSYFTALGNGLIAAIISSLRSFILVVVYLIYLPTVFGNNGIWLSMPMDEYDAVAEPPWSHQLSHH